MKKIKLKCTVCNKDFIVSRQSMVVMRDNHGIKCKECKADYNRTVAKNRRRLIIKPLPPTFKEIYEDKTGKILNYDKNRNTKTR